jgi:aspartyl-tRNA(Asn)/glutamyl-tRNA(Gln) amidotransferase subunit A
MNPSTSFSQKLLIEKEKISCSKTNSVIRTRFDKAFNEISQNGLLNNKTFLIKDNIAIKNEQLSCASNILKSYVSPFSATAIKKIQSEGGVITGQTNCDEFAMGSSSEYSIYGPVKNPHNLNLVAGGSSGGSAAAIAENLADIALGSDTGGSVRQPAAFCGIYGLKPTYGRISRYGLVAHASSFDTIGIMSKKIEDIRKTLSIISGVDIKDATSVDRRVDKYKSLNNVSLPKTLGVVKEEIINELNPEIAERYRYLVSYLKNKNVKIIEIDLPFFKYCIPTYYILTMAEASSNLSRFDGVRYGRRAKNDNLSELYIKSRNEGFSDEVKRRIMTGTYVLSSGYYDAYFSKALKVRRLIKEGYTNLLSNCNNLLIPSTPDLPFKLNNRLKDPLKMYLADMFTVPINLSGIPSLNIPAGYSSKNLPIGFQIVGNSFKEETLFSFAHLLEKEEIFEKI